MVENIQELFCLFVGAFVRDRGLSYIDKSLPEYLLIYTSETVKGWPEITDDNINILTDKDRQWLFDCNMELIAEELAKRSEKFGIDMDIAVAELEKALSQEKESLSGQQEK